MPEVQTACDGYAEVHPPVARRLAKHWRTSSVARRDLAATTSPANLIDHRDGTVSEAATGLTWSRATASGSLDWYAALAWVAAQNAQGFLGHDDWRLPNTGELAAITCRFPELYSPALPCIRTVWLAIAPPTAGRDRFRLRGTTTPAPLPDPALTTGVTAVAGAKDRLRSRARDDDHAPACANVALGQRHDAPTGAGAMRVFDHVPLVRGIGALPCSAGRI